VPPAVPGEVVASWPMPGAVRLVERIGNLRSRGQRLVERKQAFVQARRQRLPVGERVTRKWVPARGYAIVSGSITRSWTLPSTMLTK
jgi:hypothetical protein